ncbi:hypothetical protein HKO22_03015 [Peptoniphilus sp. AGMB00490]|uniref:Uncharacterized protein n=1 Tax=Peptoniphilus faecalis TaxID=2731255 RepID=A0A848RFC9_9FIRM|nr:hypothetical protein [Peptoniphilus faecalis]NMW84715.1 hypothetical protein [Peptoniphilus faecalis]
MKYTIKNDDMVQDFLDFNCKVKIIFYKSGKVEMYPLNYKIEEDKKILNIIKIANIKDYGAIKGLKIYQALQNEIMMNKTDEVEVIFK